MKTDEMRRLEKRIVEPINLTNYEFKNYGPNRKKVDIKKMMPT